MHQEALPPILMLEKCVCSSRTNVSPRLSQHGTARINRDYVNQFAQEKYAAQVCQSNKANDVKGKRGAVSS